MGFRDGHDVACPASLYPIYVRSEALRASLRSARRMSGRLTGQSRQDTVSIKNITGEEKKYQKMTMATFPCST